MTNAKWYLLSVFILTFNSLSIYDKALVYNNSLFYTLLTARVISRLDGDHIYLYDMIR